MEDEEEETVEEAVGEAQFDAMDAVGEEEPLDF
jgi:hypothetical protein